MANVVLVLLLSFSPIGGSHGLQDPSWHWGPGFRIVCHASGATVQGAGTSQVAMERSAGHVHGTVRTGIKGRGSSLMGVHQWLLPHRATVTWILVISLS